MDRSYCTTCGKERVTYKCVGCSREFCFDDLANHRQSLVKQLNDLEDERNLFRQILTEQLKNPKEPSLMQQINRWEKDSMKTIERTAEEARQVLLKHTDEHVNRTEIELGKLTEELKRIRQENDFNEIHLDRFRQKLNRLEEQLQNPSNILIQQDNSSSFVSKISVLFIEQSFDPNIDINAKWIQNGITVAGGNGQGSALNQLSKPLGFYIGDDQTIYVADQDNHRIMEWKKDATMGRVVAGGKGAGNRNNQLHGPRNVILDKQNQSLIICDRENQRVVRWPLGSDTIEETIISNIDCFDLTTDINGYFYVSVMNQHEVRRWKIGETDSTVVAGGNGQGSRVDQFNTPRYIFVDEDQSVYVSDKDNHRVMKWLKGAKEGIVIAGGQGQGNGLTQLSSPAGIVVDQQATVYVVDRGNNRVMRWSKAQQISVVVGGNKQGGERNQLHHPTGLSIDRQNNLYVVDFSNHRIQKFTIEPKSNS